MDVDEENPVTWERLSWTIDSTNIGNQLIYLTHESKLKIGLRCGGLVSVFEVGDVNLQQRKFQNFVVDNDSQIITHVFFMKDNIHALSKEGDVLCLKESKLNKTYEWFIVGSISSSILCVKELKNGVEISALNYINGSYLLEIYENWKLKTSKKLVNLPVEYNCTIIMNSYKKSDCELFDRIFQNLKSEANILLVSVPKSFIYLLSYCENLDQVYELFHTKSLIIDVFVNKNNIIIVCEDGQVLCIYEQNTKIIYKNWFLATNVMTCDIIVSENCTKLVWSNLNDIFLTNLDLAETYLKITLVSPSLRGIFKFISINHDILCVNLNRCFYKLGSNVEFEKCLTHDELLNEILKSSLEMETHKITNTKHDEYFKAFMIAQNNDVQSLMKIDHVFDMYKKMNNLMIENNSDFTFNKEIWKLQLEIDIKGKTFCKIFSFAEDLTPNSNVVFGTDQVFKNLNGSVYNFNLIGTIPECNKVLMIKLNDLVIKCSESNYDCELQKIINKNEA